ncbi:MAG: hypothetical protein EXR27_12425 [Betaproteobacteria bacterium]|nr:hypothetical protein [Betaproteobacteria bacterium]
MGANRIDSMIYIIKDRSVPALTRRFSFFSINSSQLLVEPRLMMALDLWRVSGKLESLQHSVFHRLSAGLSESDGRIIVNPEFQARSRQS